MSYGALVKNPLTNPRPAFECNSCGEPVASGQRSSFVEVPVIDEDGRFVRDEYGHTQRKLVALAVEATCSNCVSQGPYRSRAEARANRRADRHAERAR